jgi:hypothetical protein
MSIYNLGLAIIFLGIFVFNIGFVGLIIPHKLPIFKQVGRIRGFGIFLIIFLFLIALGSNLTSEYSLSITTNEKETNNDKIKLEGVFKKPDNIDAKILINGTELKIIDNNSFSYDQALNLGPNSFIVILEAGDVKITKNISITRIDSNKIGNELIQSDTDEKLAKEIYRNSKSLIDQGFELESIRASNLKECGNKMRSLMYLAKLLDEDAKKLPMDYLQIKSLPRRALLCVTCQSTAIDHCRIGRDEMNKIDNKYK